MNHSFIIVGRFALYTSSVLVYMVSVKFDINTRYKQQYYVMWKKCNAKIEENLQHIDIRLTILSI